MNQPITTDNMDYRLDPPETEQRTYKVKISYLHVYEIEVEAADEEAAIEAAKKLMGSISDKDKSSSEFHNAEIIDTL